MRIVRGCQSTGNEGVVMLSQLDLGTDGLLDKARQRLAFLQHGLGRIAQRGIDTKRRKGGVFFL